MWFGSKKNNDNNNHNDNNNNNNVTEIETIWIYRYYCNFLLVFYCYFIEIFQIIAQFIFDLSLIEYSFSWELPRFCPLVAFFDNSDCNCHKCFTAHFRAVELGFSNPFHLIIFTSIDDKNHFGCKTLL